MISPNPSNERVGTTETSAARYRSTRSRSGIRAEEADAGGIGKSAAQLLETGAFSPVAGHEQHTARRRPLHRGPGVGSRSRPMRASSRRTDTTKKASWSTPKRALGFVSITGEEPVEIDARRHDPDPGRVDAVALDHQPGECVGQDDHCGCPSVDGSLQCSLGPEHRTELPPTDLALVGPGPVEVDDQGPMPQHRS